VSDNDPLADARARADAVLRADAWLSLKTAVWSCVTGTGAMTAIGAALVTQGLLSKALFGWAVLLAALLSGPLVYAANEMRRLYERSLALRDLVGAMKQYEVLIRDARSERDDAKSRVIALEQQVAFQSGALENLARSISEGKTK